jgi:hypothetical protein
MLAVPLLVTTMGLAKPGCVPDAQLFTSVADWKTIAPLPIVPLLFS